jgi:hypothetical protein
VGLLSSSKSSSTQNYEANPVTTDEGIGISARSSNVSVNVLDGGVVSRALDSVDKASAIGGQGFAALLDAANGLFDRGQALIGQTQTAVADAYGQARTDTAGTIDNRTMIVLAMAAVAAVVFMRGR